MIGLEWTSIIAALSLILLVTWSIVTTKEQKQGQRFFAVRLRDFLDSVINKCSTTLKRWFISVTRHKMKLSWYYSIHAVLVATLAFLGATYTKIENVVISNRAKAKKIRKEKLSFKKNHLTEIAEHKVTVQLSEKEQARRKDASLKG